MGGDGAHAGNAAGAHKRAAGSPLKGGKREAGRDTKNGSSPASSLSSGSGSASAKVKKSLTLEKGQKAALGSANVHTPREPERNGESTPGSSSSLSSSPPPSSSCPPSASVSSKSDIHQRVSARFSTMPGLSPLSRAFLESAGFTFATPVQEACLSLLLADSQRPAAYSPKLSRKDLAVEAPTGSGKTLAFVLPVIERVLDQLQLFSLGRLSSSEFVWERERGRRAAAEKPLGEEDASAAKKRRTDAPEEVKKRGFEKDEEAGACHEARREGQEASPSLVGDAAASPSPEFAAFLARVLERRPPAPLFSEASGEAKACRIAAVLLAPTRELARQIFNVVQSLVRFVEATVLLRSDAPCALSATEKRKQRKRKRRAAKTSDAAAEDDNEAQDDEATAENAEAAYPDGAANQGEGSEANEQLTSAFVLQSMLLTGGSRPVEGDLRALELRASARALFILVATPGRLARLIEAERSEGRRLHWRFEALDFVVVDEADRLIDEQHTDELRGLLTYFREQKKKELDRRQKPQGEEDGKARDAQTSGLQVAVFSATLTGAMQEQSKTKDLWGVVREPVCVRVSAATADARDEPSRASDIQHHVPKTLSNFYAICDYEAKLPFLVDFIKTRVIPHQASCIVFLLTCHCVEYFSGLLHALLLAPSSSAPSSSAPPPCSSLQLSKLHGRMKQRARLAACKRFASSCAPATPEAHVLLATDVAARGLDFPNVDWILQLDPPQNPDVFVHRVGRAARAGRSGNALLLLLPHEDAYLPFLANRGISVAPLDSSSPEKPENADEETEEKKQEREINEAAMNEVIHDRALVLKGSKAFVSFVRAYKEHQLSFLLPFQRLDIGRLATAFRLLRLPRIKEIMGRQIAHFSQSPVDPLKIPFRFDSAREAERVAGLSEALELREKKKEERNRKRENEKKKQKEKDERQMLRGALKPTARTKAEKRKAKRRNALDEWEELAFEERMARKLRKGKISETQYEKELKKHGEQFAEDLDSDLGAGDSDNDPSDGEEDGKAPSQGCRASDESEGSEREADSLSAGSSEDLSDDSDSDEDSAANKRREEYPGARTEKTRKKQPKWITSRGRKTKKKKWSKRRK
ncbi:DEAD/DEAH box helicase domain-containing protein [Besnoitia besnoiti]|uniref:ATP-dependent RNA helicase n=1 Tax=Besnoitia besnoiti TaxID=94643 RepID=A0A2A9MBV8_BESBE|nr:DEAD/DEAH box helicase domain-containing protein [Besnoitia besnoiti]PFH35958.1 DEAD/DEAH box helicase domain-containing protein [Besnoitia besnoiti]